MSRVDPGPLDQSVAGPVPGLVDVARTREQVEAVRPWWTSLRPRDIDCDPDHFLTVVDHDPRDVTPHVIRVRTTNGECLVVARRVRERFPVRIGYRTLFSLTARALVVSFDGVLGATSEEDLRTVVDVVRRQVEAGEADVVIWQKLPVDGAVDRAVRGSVAPGLVMQRAEVPLYSMDTTESWDRILQRRPSKSRQRIRREISVFRRDHADRWALERIDAEGGAERVGDVDAVARATYQTGLGIGGPADELQNSLRELSLARGWFRAWLLYIDRQPVAYWTGMLFHGTFFPGATGYDQDHAQSRAGSVLFTSMLEELCEDPGVERVMFGYGDAEYKAKFATHVETTADVLVFADRPRPRLLLVSLRGLDRLVARVRGVVERAGLDQRIKRRWRSRAARGPAPARGGADEPGSGQAGPPPEG